MSYPAFGLGVRKGPHHPRGARPPGARPHARELETPEGAIDNQQHEAEDGWSDGCSRVRLQEKVP